MLDVDGYRLPVVAEVFEAILDELRDRTDTPYYVQANLMEVHEAGSGCAGGEEGSVESRSPPTEISSQKYADANAGSTCRPFAQCRTQWISSCEGYRACRGGGKPCS